MKVTRLSIPVDFNLSFLKIRWSDHVLVYPDISKSKRRGSTGRSSSRSNLNGWHRDQPLGEGVVYGNGWEKAERLARQMARMKFGRRQGELPMCEQIFIVGDEQQMISNKQLVRMIQRRGSSLKVKVGRSVFEDVKLLRFIRNELKFTGGIRVDANQGYSLRQLQYLIPTLKEIGVKYVEEPVKKVDLKAATQILRQSEIGVILDETLQSRKDWEWVIKEKVFEVANIKLSRVGDIGESRRLIKLAKKEGIKVVIGCSEELERGMKAIFFLGHEAKEQGNLLEVEGFGDLRLKPYLERKVIKIPRWLNRGENLVLMISHRARQLGFDWWWNAVRVGVGLVKKTKLLSSLSLHLVKLTGKHSQRIHPKHLIAQKHRPVYMSYIGERDVVLDVGCGNGQHSVRVAGKARSVVGIDTDIEQLDLARELVIEKKLKKVVFRRMSAEKKLDFVSNKFSRVLLLGVLEHLKNRDQLLTEIYRVLKPGGLLLLGVPSDETSWKKLQMRFGVLHFTDPDHLVEYSKDSIDELLRENGFRVKKILPTAYDTPWAGIIDVVGGVSLSLYERMIQWKWKKAREEPENSISFFIVAERS